MDMVVELDDIQTEGKHVDLLEGLPDLIERYAHERFRFLFEEGSIEAPNGDGDAEAGWVEGWMCSDEYHEVVSATVQSLVQRLRENPVLESLDANGNVLRSAAVGLVEGLANKTTLERLNLGNNDISDVGVDGIALALAKTSTLKHLDLIGNRQTGGEGMRGLARLLCGNTSLQSLDLSRMRPTPRALAPLMEALAANSTLRRLTLSHEGFGDEGVACVASALSSSPALQELVLNGNLLSAGAAGRLAAALAANTTLRCLHLRRCGICPTGGRHLADSLETNSTLHELDLDSNFIGGEATARLLATASPLQRLCLTRCALGPPDAELLAGALAGNTTLRELQMNVNGIGDQRAAGLAAALARNSTLRQLGLVSTGIGPAGAGHIAGALASCRLEQLNLAGNAIEDAGVARLADALSRNTWLLHLSVGGGAMTQASGVALAGMVRENGTLQRLSLRMHPARDIAAAVCEALPVNFSLLQLDGGDFHEHPLLDRNKRFQADRRRIGRTLGAWRTVINVHKYKRYLRRQRR